MSLLSTEKSFALNCDIERVIRGFDTAIGEVRGYRFGPGFPDRRVNSTGAPTGCNLFIQHFRKRDVHDSLKPTVFKLAMLLPTTLQTFRGGIQTGQCSREATQTHVCRYSLYKLEWIGWIAPNLNSSMTRTSQRLYSRFVGSLECC